MTRACGWAALLVVLLFGVIVLTDDHLAKSVSSLVCALFLACYLPLHVRAWRSHR
jgi:hypothetical protein